MKKTLLSIVSIVFVMVSVNPVVLADQADTKVEPNVYEKREIEIMQKRRDQVVEKDKLPAEQLALTFTTDKLTESEKLTEVLFQTNVLETNTITSKADKMNLFSEGTIYLKKDKEDIHEEKTNLLRVVMIIILTVIVALLFVMIPRLQRNDA